MTAAAHEAGPGYMRVAGSVCTHGGRGERLRAPLCRLRQGEPMTWGGLGWGGHQVLRGGVFMVTSI